MYNLGLSAIQPGLKCVSFSFNPHVDMIPPRQFSRMVKPGSPDLLHPDQEFSLPISRSDMPDPRLAVFTITPPTYVPFPFADPFDGEDLLSTLLFSPLPAPPGFAPIGPPGSLPAQPVNMDTVSRDCYSTFPPVSRINSEQLSTVPDQPIEEETSAVRNTLSCPSPIGPSPFVPADPEVCSTILVSLTGRSVRQLFIAKFGAV